MCLSKKKVSTPDTSVQDAEARRQRELEEQRYRERLAAEQARWDAERAADERRYAEQRAAQEAEAERQRAMMQAEIDRQIAAELAAEARREQERQEVLAQQQERAAQSRAYTDGRQALITEAEGAINAAYSGFDDAYFQDFARSMIQTQAPELERQATAKGRELTMGAARRGNLKSSAAARQFGDLSREKAAAQAQLAGQASDAASSFRSNIDAQRRDALTSIWSAGAVGSENLPDGVSDANTALGGIGAQLGALTQTARNRAASVTRPTAF